MTSERPAVLGISPRRSACDRCRGQKLRCLRDRDEKRCRRCVRVDSECVTSSIFRMRNYVSDDAAMRPRLHHLHQLQEQPRFSTTNSTATVAAAASTAETIDLTALLADPVPISMFANHAAGPGSSANPREPSHLHPPPTTAILEHLPDTNSARATSSATCTPSAADRLAVWRRISPMNSTLFNFVLFPHTVEAIVPSRDDNSSPMNRQTQVSSVLDLVTRTTLSTHPTECRVHDIPGLDHAGGDRLPTALDL
jgi:hypothetical protein